MSNSSAGTERARPTAASSKGIRLIHAAALAAVLVPLGSVAVETSTINCISQGSGSCIGGYESGGGPQSNTWKFFVGSDLKYTLQIAGNPQSSFTLNVRDLVRTQAFLEDTGALDNFPNAVCIPTFDPGLCGLFRVTEFTGTADWVDGYVLTITWFSNADPLSSPPNDGRNTILQARGSSTVFGNELLQIIYDPAPSPTDPGISGRGDAFSTFAAVRTIPEPSSMALLGMSVAGLLHRARRRKSNR